MGTVALCISFPIVMCSVISFNVHVQYSIMLELTFHLLVAKCKAGEYYILGISKFVGVSFEVKSFLV